MNNDPNVEHNDGLGCLSCLAELHQGMKRLCGQWLEDMDGLACDGGIRGPPWHRLVLVSWSTKTCITNYARC